MIGKSKKLTVFFSVALVLIVVLFSSFYMSNSSIVLNKAEEPFDRLESEWATDFFDDFDTFNADNWQDQRIWVNNEKQCYVPDGKFGTREVSNGTLKLKVINVGQLQSCDNLDKHGV